MDPAAARRPLHLETPLLRSTPLSRAAGAEVWLKLEALQPVGSFKIRGVGHACQDAVARGATRLVCSSGGNAGLAVAYAGRHLGVPVEVFVPASTPEWMRDVIRAEGAAVSEHGTSWDDAHAHARKRATAADTAYIHPFDDPRLWAGHASMIAESAAAMARPDAVIVSVGGGGLLLGVLEGMHGVGWQDVPVLAVETAGADSFAQSVAAGEQVTLPTIDSVAKSLGARTVARSALEWRARHDIRPVVVEDAAAVGACARFLDDHRLLVEPACGASLALAYEAHPALEGFGSVLVIVCGGAGARLDQLRAWQAEV